MKKGGIGIICLLFFVSCRKNESTSGNYEKVIGTWIWMYTVRKKPVGSGKTTSYLIYDTLYPSELNLRQKLVIDKKGCVFCYQNDKLLLKTNTEVSGSNHISLIKYKSNGTFLKYDFEFYFDKDTNSSSCIWIDSPIEPTIAEYDYAYYKKQ